MMDERAALNKQSVIAEEKIGVMKNKKSGTRNRRFRKPEHNMNKILKDKFLSNRFKYDDVPNDIGTLRKTAELQASAFEPPLEEWSMPFKELEGT